jgi:hypothetical protein
VIDALMDSLPRDAAPSRQNSLPNSGGSTSSEAPSPVVGGPSRALDAVLSAVKNRDGRLQPEVRANACALLGQLGRPGVLGPDRAPELARLKDAARPVLDAVASSGNTQTGGELHKQQPQTKSQNIVASAAKRALEAWSA